MQEKNKAFGKLLDGGIVFAPKSFEHEGTKYNLTNREDIYNKIGFYRIEYLPQPLSDALYKPFWTQAGKTIYRSWELVEEALE